VERGVVVVVAGRKYVIFCETVTIRFAKPEFNWLVAVASNGAE
jgi:hypothetical protein